MRRSAANRTPSIAPGILVLCALGLLVLQAGTAIAAPSIAEAERLKQRIARVDEEAQGIERALKAAGENFEQVNGALASLTAWLHRERDALLGQDEVLSVLRAEQEVALQALVEVQLQRYLTGDASGAAVPVEVRVISDPSLRALVVGATEAGQDPMDVLNAHAGDAIGRIDVQLDLSRELLVSIERDSAQRDHLLQRQRHLLARLDDLRQDAALTGMELAALQARQGGGAVVDPTVVPVDGSGPFSVCPVDAPRVIADDFGAPRYSGGYHEHAGNDILAPRGTPIRAPFDGVATDATNSLGGLSVRVTGSEGYVYNAHLERFGDLGRVHAGDVVGYVGDSGNAAGGPTHNHFEWHPGENDAVDPNPALLLSCS